MALTYMSDETYVQSALMNSPLRDSLVNRNLTLALALTLTLNPNPAPHPDPHPERDQVNHNLRYIDWPHGYGDPSAYWRAVGLAHASGPMVLSLELLPRVFRSGAAFARKVDPNPNPNPKPQP